MMILTLLTATFLTSFSTTASGSKLVEIQLIEKLDEPRSYCIDIKGYKERAKVHRGLQAHTCYSYQGQLGVTKPSKRISSNLGGFTCPRLMYVWKRKTIMKVQV